MKAGDAEIRIDHGLSIRPDAGQWHELLKEPSPDRGQRRFREQLGLPADRPIILSGHQAGFWHCGILAKYLATRAGSCRLGAHPAWLVVDQDDNDPGMIDLPIRDADGRLQRHRWRLDPGERDRAMPTGSAPPIRPRAVALPTGATAALESVERGVAAIRAALDAHADAASLAEQFSAALADLISPITEPMATVSALSIARTDLFQEIVDRMRSAPEACAGAYNAARNKLPRLGVRALRIDDRRVELPLWRVRPGHARMPVHAEELGSIPPAELAPRGLLMTGLLRLAGCDLFIHGTGGGGGDGRSGGDEASVGYDRITEVWFKSWLDPERALAPVAVVTATMRLPLDGDVVPTAAQIARAQWLAHSAAHSPELLGDDDAQRQKRDLLATIRNARPGDPRRAKAYRQMHELLSGLRLTHAGQLDQLRAEANRLADDERLSQIVHDRTWPFPLHSERSLDELAGQIERAFGASIPHARCAGR